MPCETFLIAEYTDPVFGPIAGFLAFIALIVMAVRWVGQQLGNPFPQPSVAPRFRMETRDTSVAKNGLPYCPQCNRQVSLRRDECRACGHIYRKRYWVAIDKTPTELAAEAAIEEARIADRDRRARAAKEAERRRLERAESRRAWYAERGIDPTPFAAFQLLPAWLQSVALGASFGAIAICMVAPTAFSLSLLLRILFAAIGLAFVAATIAIMRQKVREIPAPIASHAEAVEEKEEAEAEEIPLESRAPELIVLIVRQLKTRPAAEFDLPMLATRLGIGDKTTIEAATIEVYARYARTVVADGVVTAQERRKMDSLAAMLAIPHDDAARIEEAARRTRYEEAMQEVFADGVVTAEEAAMLGDLRESLGLLDAQVVAPDGH